MKNLFLTAAIIFTASAITYGQNQVVDTHPNATIYVYDPQTSQEVLAETNEAILFKDALVQLVANTSEARLISRVNPGHKSIVVTQSAPEQGNVYQVEMIDRLFGKTTTIYTFSYNIDHNTLYYYDLNSQSWLTEQIAPGNMDNLNDAFNYGKFNDPQNWATTDDGTGDSQVQVQTNTAPPPLQEYDQPECPVDGYLWQPGYWAYNNEGGYYWVRGTWVAPPNPGYLWTPPYWGYEGGIYLFHGGYWGVSIGFYGGINYGYGYGGRGFYGGNWEGGRFRYNTAVVRVNTTVVHNTYVDRTVIVNNTVVNNRKVSFNGQGGVQAKPTPEEVKVAAQPHVRDHSQDPKAPVVNTNKPFVAGQKGATPNAGVNRTQGANTTPANTQKMPGAANAQRTPGSNATAMPGVSDAQKTPGANNNAQKSPAVMNPNAPKVPGTGTGPGVPRVPSNGPGVSSAGNGNGAGRVNNTTGGQQNQKQPMQQNQGQNGGNQKGGKQQPVKTDKNPPAKSDDKKKPNN